MRPVLALLALLPAAALAQPPTVEYSGPIRGPVVVPKTVAVKVTEYVLIDGRRVAIAEWTELRTELRPALTATAQPPPHCVQCGTSCACSPCQCGAVPQVKATSPPPPPTIPAYYGPPVYYAPPTYYPPAPTYSPPTYGAGFNVQVGPVRAGACVGSKP